MESRKLNLLNSLTLISIGFWGYLETNSITALIPVAFGFGLLLCNRGIKKENKIIAHVAVFLTLIMLLALLGMRLPKSISSGGPGLYRVLLMIITSTLSMIGFIRSFIMARKNK